MPIMAGAIDSSSACRNSSVTVAADTDADARRTEANTRSALFVTATFDIALTRSVVIRVTRVTNDNAAFTALAPATAVFVADHTHVLNVTVLGYRTNRKGSRRSSRCKKRSGADCQRDGELVHFLLQRWCVGEPTDWRPNGSGHT